MIIETRLNEVIRVKLEKLEGMTVGSDEHKAAVDELTRLMDRAIEIEKINVDVEDKTKTRKDDRNKTIVRTVVDVVTVAVGTGVTIWGTLKSFEFEKTGNITTIMGRGFINKLLPKK